MTVSFTRDFDFPFELSLPHLVRVGLDPFVDVDYIVISCVSQSSFLSNTSVDLVVETILGFI